MARPTWYLHLNIYKLFSKGNFNRQSWFLLTTRFPSGSYFPPPCCQKWEVDSDSFILTTGPDLTARPSPAHFLSLHCGLSHRHLFPGGPPGLPAGLPTSPLSTWHSISTGATGILQQVLPLPCLKPPKPLSATHHSQSKTQTPLARPIRTGPCLPHGASFFPFLLGFRGTAFSPFLQMSQGFCSHVSLRLKSSSPRTSLAPLPPSGQAFPGLSLE